jgi:hypothetical protein
MTGALQAWILDLVKTAQRSRPQVCCDGCYRTSPPIDLSIDDAHRYFRRLGWAWRLDGRTLCPICNAREDTVPPPPAAVEDHSD